jgi:hypothetical protein
MVQVCLTYLVPSRISLLSVISCSNISTTYWINIDQECSLNDREMVFIGLVFAVLHCVTLLEVKGCALFCFQENILQSFKLPHAVLCIGGVVIITRFLHMVSGGICFSFFQCVPRGHVQVLGNPLSRELAVAPCENGVVLKYHKEPRRSNVRRCDLAGDDEYNPLK